MIRICWKKSVETFKQALDLLEHFSQIAVAYYSIGRSYARIANCNSQSEERLGLYDRAAHFLNLALEEDRTFQFAYYWLGMVYKERCQITLNKEDCLKAKEFFTEAIQLKPNFVEALTEMNEVNEFFKNLEQLPIKRAFNFIIDRR